MNGLLKLLQNGGYVVVAEGYLWELEHRGFLQLGSFLPVVVLERPSAVKSLHEEFALAGSDVIEAFTYYGHRELMRQQGREGDLVKLNRDALRIARGVADEYGKLMAGNLSKTSLYRQNHPECHAPITDIFKEQIEWAVDGGADFIIAETFYTYGEALLALNAIKQFGNGLPAVITLTACFPDRTTDDVPFPEACRRLEDQGAAVVGINCTRGPDSMLPLIKKIRKACNGPIAAVPVPFRTTPEEMTFQSVTDPKTGKILYPDNVDCVRCSREDIRKFAEDAKKAGVQYIGLCCGNGPYLMREVAEAYGRKPPASAYSCDMKKSVIWGDLEEETRQEMEKVQRFMLNKEIE